MGPEDAEEDVGGQRPRGGRLHHPGLPLPRVRPLLLREERVVRAPLQEQHGKSSAEEYLTKRKQSQYLCDLNAACLRNSQ